MSEPREAHAPRVLFRDAHFFGTRDVRAERDALALAERAYFLYSVPDRIGGAHVDQIEESRKSNEMNAMMNITARLKRLEKTYHGLENVTESILESDISLNPSTVMEYPKI